jgi:Rrf2 family transcriptional regulator, iron-sulfur cluster assembly transcription factor
VKISNKGRYAVRALFDIAYFNGGQPTQAKDIAERQGIPARFLEQIFQDLKKAGIVGSKRGPQGGYSLAGEASAIRLGDIIRALEGPLVLSDGSSPGANEAAIDVTEAVFADLSKRVEECFDAVSLEDVCQRAQLLGVRPTATETFSYVI